MDKPKAIEAIIAAMLPHVPFDGWSMRALERGTVDAGYRPEDIVRLFPRGIADVLDAFAGWLDARMQKDWEALNPKPEKIRARITQLLRFRLEAMAPYREAMRRLLPLYTMPGYMGQGVQTLSRTMSAVWHAAGDTSTDFNWYTKRAMLAAVYTSTVRVWLSDKSPDFQDTYAFLDRRIENVMAIQKFKAKIFPS